MKYVADTLGIQVNTAPWDGTARLPYYLSDRYEFNRTVFDGVTCLIMKPKGELDVLGQVKKHIAKVREIEPLPIVLELNNMTARRRKSLIGARIPFIVLESHIYLPCLGVALSERYTTEHTPGEIFMPSAQLLFFHYLYQDEPEIHTAGTADLFGFSEMQISRAIKQLNGLGLVAVRKDGVQTVIASKEPRRDLFERAQPYFLNPVRKKMYVEHGELPPDLPLSGYSALSELTMLGAPATETVAFFGKVGELAGTDTLIDNTEQVEVEIWRYNPTVLSKYPGVADVLSLAASVPLDDERVEQAIDGLLSNLWGNE